LPPLAVLALAMVVLGIGDKPVTKDFAVQANLNNVFDKEYYDYLGTYGVYGAPRNFSVSASYSF
jgi:outer membrane receptor protein involved in Fe transport